MDTLTLKKPLELHIPFAFRLQNKDSEILAESVVELLKEESCCTITVDNGKEFAQHKYITQVHNRRT